MTPLPPVRPLDIDVVALTVPLQGDAVVEMALLEHSLAQTQVFHQVDDPVFQHAGSDGAFHVGWRLRDSMMMALIPAR